MAASLNKVTLIGNLGKDPEFRSTNEGKEIATFSLATSESWKDRATGEKKEKTEWHRVVIFNDGLVNVVKNYVKKGSKLYIEGALQTRKWVDNAGVEKYTTEIVLQNFGSSLIMLDNKGSGGDSFSSGGASGGSSQGGSFDHSDLDDDIPF
jgi:single-strand DNA-binding protein